MANLDQLFFRNVAQTSPTPLALEIDSAKGSYLFDTRGNRYLDLISGICVSALGHGHPKVVEAARDQIDRHLHTMVYGEHIQAPQVRFAHTIAGLLPDSLCTVYFVNSGSEAVEGAMKLCRKYTGRFEIVAARNAYHGSTHGAESLRSDIEFTRSYRPMVPGIRHLRFNHTEDLEMITESTAGVIIEPVQGEAGVILPEEGYLDALRSRCDETGTLLIFDEIQTGFGRSGSFFAFQRFGVVPDILLSAKGLGGGLPLGAFISSPDIMQSLSKSPILGHITTFGGHPLSCATGLAALEVLMQEGILQEIDGKANMLRQGLLDLPEISEVRNCGLLMAAQLRDAEGVPRFIEKAFQEGLLMDWFLFRPDSFRIAPPLTISDEEIREALDKIHSALKKL